MYCMVFYLKINICKYIFILFRLFLKILCFYYYLLKCRLIVNENKIVCEIKKEDICILFLGVR